MAFLSLVARTYPRKRGSGGIQTIPVGFERDIIRNLCACVHDVKISLSCSLAYQTVGILKVLLNHAMQQSMCNGSSESLSARFKSASFAH